jgi:hypothetical protein
MMVQGILVHGGNHFIVSGRRPSFGEARKLAWGWEMPMPGRPPADTSPWTIVTRAWREELAWAVVLRSDEPHSVAVAGLLEELRQRGVAVAEE